MLGNFILFCSCESEKRRLDIADPSEGGFIRVENKYDVDRHREIKDRIIVGAKLMKPHLFAGHDLRKSGKDQSSISKCHWYHSLNIDSRSVRIISSVSDCYDNLLQKDGHVSV
jgi:hypothetical protein